ncbi:cutinase-like protein [Microthyrium microscopicum]|uniref:cutinase n=1 Tax=Microthyrium microscopicum TaxID=703497 RepID=A0A6A6URX9_9PEZI|nr:cutinase-like protein [Microthyrium microscopicum]
MKITGVITLAGMAAALPQSSSRGPTSYSLGEKCPDAVLVVARGSMEPGNVGITVGPMLCSALKTKLADKFDCQGINAPGYPAAIGDNFKEKGSCDTCIEAGVKTFTDVHTKCPKAKLTFMGYSQGAALMHNVIPALPADVKSSIVGGVLFGDTKNQQSSATITGWPKDKFRTYCLEDDGVCHGELQLTGGHFAYTGNGDAQKAIDYLTQIMTGSA